MASNIRKKIPSSSTLYIHDVFRAAPERFASEYGHLGPIKIVDTVKEAATDAKVVISVVPTGKNVREVYLDEKVGLVAAPKDSDRLILECSTIEVAATREVGEAVMAAGHGTYADTPLSVRFLTTQSRPKGQRCD